MKKNSVLLLLVLFVFLLCCKSENNELLNNENANSIDPAVTFKNPVISFSKVSSSSFYYEVDENDTIINKIDLIFGNNVVTLEESRGIVENLMSDSIYTIKVNYSYYNGEEN